MQSIHSSRPPISALIIADSFEELVRTSIPNIETHLGIGSVAAPVRHPADLSAIACLLVLGFLAALRHSNEHVIVPILVQSELVATSRADFSMAAEKGNEEVATLNTLGNVDLLGKYGLAVTTLGAGELRSATAVMGAGCTLLLKENKRPALSRDAVPRKRPCAAHLFISRRIILAAA
jgi:hypothetical protein